jgi:polar amino acid transport system substrate-binding protein
LSAYLSGQIDLIATGNIVVAEISSRMPDRKPATKFLLKNSPCYIGIYKGETRLQQKVNELITTARSDGSLNKFSENWLKAPLPADL